MGIYPAGTRVMGTHCHPYSGSVGGDLCSSFWVVHKLVVLYFCKGWSPRGLLVAQFPPGVCSFAVYLLLSLGKIVQRGGCCLGRNYSVIALLG
jgi:hypothetical protein